MTSKEFMTALLVDRDPDTRQMYSEYLRHESVEIDEAGDGREALAKALARPHDLLITETRLPGINGYDLCQLLRSDASTAAMPIIVVTGDGLPVHVERAQKAGADAVLVKPCLPHVLLLEIRRLVMRSKELRQHSENLRLRANEQVSRATHLPLRVRKTHRALSRSFVRQETIAPPAAPPVLVCPICDQPLTYLRSHVGGVSERHLEQWDYYECSKSCGTFQYRARTRKLRKVS